VIGQTDEDSGQAICAFVTLQGELYGSESIEKEILETVADRIVSLAPDRELVHA